jgi:hypothetical protein
MKAQADKESVFAEPRLLADPAAYAPVTNTPTASTNPPASQPRRARQSQP